MSTQGLVRSLSTRSVKKLEKPRPLKITQNRNSTIEVTSPRPTSGNFDDIMFLVETVAQCITNQNFDDSLIFSITNMSNSLKKCGQQLEAVYKDQLDRAFVIFRNGCRDDRVNYVARLYLLELIELRANQWGNCDNLQSYYSSKMATTEMEPLPTTPDANIGAGIGLSPLTAQSPTAPPILSPGEVLKNSGKFQKPTKIPGKNYCKDEVVIRNSDSGKVSPGAKERLVQITGPTEERIMHAKHLMEDTIRRNASPIREPAERERMGGSSSSLNSSASDESNRLPQTGVRRSTLLHSFSTNDANIGEYKYTVTLDNETLKITGSNHELVRNAKLILEEYYPEWVKRNNINTGDCLTHYDEDVFLSPVSNSSTIRRLGSQDSGNGNGPSTSTSGDSDDITCISALPAPTAASSGCVSRVYSREFLLECALSQLARVTPLGWEHVCREFSGIVKKVPPLPPLPQPPTPPSVPFRRHSYNDTPQSCTPKYSYTDSWTSADQYTYAN